MAVQILTFHAAYAGLEDRLWRDLEVSSNYRLDQLGYVVLAAFDTMAYHLFEVTFREKTYSIPDPDNPPEYLDMADYKLGDLGFRPGETMEVVYDFGTEHRFLLTFTAAREMRRGESRHYPWIAAMEGRGIIDDTPSWELVELVRQIDENGETDEPVYYSCYGVDEEFLPAPWDIRRFDLKVSNALLKGDTEAIAQDYAPFWKTELSATHRKKGGKQSANQKNKLSDQELCSRYFAALLDKNPPMLKKLFRKDAVIEWPCTGEQFTREYFIQVNCDYPGQWNGEIESILSSSGYTVMVTRVWAADNSSSFHCVSILKTRQNKIAALTEYWAEDGSAPEWRKILGAEPPMRAAKTGDPEKSNA